MPESLSWRHICKGSMSKRFGSWFNFSRTCLVALLVVTFAWSSEFLALNFLLCISMYLPPKKAKAGTMWEGLGKSRRYKDCLHNPHCNSISWEACFLHACKVPLPCCFHVVIFLTISSAFSNCSPQPRHTTSKPSYLLAHASTCYKMLKTCFPASTELLHISCVHIG